ncbi:hypothetical protein CEXT_177881 [Caerostris extrusa]|uniref:Uncharacterized protein n=1 Tax=Caerostris extrusa TaxID=172846 RepID=A0AAV4W836_CAEEX|nr:hypothetical protein CEXT_177881 [Caerostris extrusa]
MQSVVRVLQAHLVKEWWAKWAVKYSVLCSSWGKDTEKPQCRFTTPHSKMAAFTMFPWQQFHFAPSLFPPKIVIKVDWRGFRTKLYLVDAES